MNELSFLEGVARGPLTRRRSDSDFVLAQWFRDALDARGYLRIAPSNPADALPADEQRLCVLGLTPAGETYLAVLRADRRKPLWQQSKNTPAP